MTQKWIPIAAMMACAPVLHGHTPTLDTLASDFQQVGKLAEWNGRIFVTDRKERSIRIYSSSGKLERKRTFDQGDQLGEFIAGPSWVAVNDSMVVCTDIGTPRLLVFSTALVPRTQFYASGAGVSGVAIEPGGALLVAVWTGDSAIVEKYNTGGLLLGRKLIAVTPKPSRTNIFTLVPLSDKRYIALFHFDNKVSILSPEASVEHTIRVDEVAGADGDAGDYRALKRNSLQCACDDGAGGFWMVLGSSAASPKREMVHMSAAGKTLARASLPTQTYFMMRSRSGDLLLVPEARTLILRSRAQWLFGGH